MDSADINTRLQLSDTSSIPPMHGGFLLAPLDIDVTYTRPIHQVLHVSALNKQIHIICTHLIDNRKIS